MSSELLNALKMVADERAIEVGELIMAIEQAVAEAASRRLGRENLTSRFDQARGEFDLFETLEVVDAVSSPWAQIAVDEARALDPAAMIGGTVSRKVAMEGLGRIAALSVRQMIHKKGRELEIDHIVAGYRSRIGQVVTGKMMKKLHDDILIDLGEGVEAILPKAEQSALDRFERGRALKLQIVEARAGKREPLVTLSRIRPELLRRLVETETPEIQDGLVEIVAVARDGSGRSKVAMRGKKGGVDPVGAVIGVRGGRIQPVTRELSGEKIDVFAWSDDPKELIASALTPAKGVTVVIPKEGRRAFAIVPDDQLSPAIGKKGVNIKLAVKITGWDVEALSQAEYDEMLKRLKGAESGEPPPPAAPGGEPSGSAAAG
ncbi:MAG: transcription termination factor NusA [Nitrospinae bacterium]|nr:transcription termination factor NusA [Nitrospinota bacterium]